METKLAVSIAARFASDDATRERLCRVNVEATRAWATDGHRVCLIACDGAGVTGSYTAPGVRLEYDQAANPPAIDSMVPSELPTLRLTLDRGHRLALQDLREYIGRSTGILHFSHEDPAAIVLTLEKGSGKKRVTYKTRLLFTDNWPIIRSTPVGTSYEFAINIDYLLDAMNVLGDLDEYKLHQENPYAPIVMERGDVKIVTMPCRV